jgi:hypothetical protein
VRDHREVASLLAYSGAAAPPGLWDKLAAALDDPAMPVDAPVLAPITSITAGRPTVVPNASLNLGGRRGIALLSAAAAVLILVGAVGGLSLRRSLQAQDSRLSLVNSKLGSLGAESVLSQAVLAAGSSPGARTVHMRVGAGGPVLADAVVTQDGSSYLYNVHLPSLPADRAYQMWAIVGQSSEKRSVGVLGSAPRLRAFNVPTTSVVALAITEEVAAGVATTNKQAVVFGVVPADGNAPVPVETTTIP